MALDVSLERILDNLRVRLPGVLDKVLVLEVTNVVDDFCRYTNVLQETIEVNFPANEKEVDLVPTGPGAQIVRLMWLLDGTDYSQSKTVKAYLTNEGVLTLKTAPTSAATYYATIAVVPGLADLEDEYPYPDVPDWFWAANNQAIQDGVMARMMTQPAKPYTNASLASKHEKMYRAAANVARNESKQLNLFGAQTWNYPQGFATGRRYR